jgi:translation initiation factor 4E
MTTPTEQKIITIFDNPINYNAKHPLARKWSLHFDSPTKKISDTNWAENIKKVYTFNTVEDFWGIFNNILPPSYIKFGSNYYFFKENINPMWEDPENKNGGKWCIQFKKGYADDVNKIWQITLLHCIGEVWWEEDSNKNYTDSICGIIVNIRKYQDKVNIWIKDKYDKNTIDFIGKKLQKLLPLDCILTYSDHHN